MSEFTYSKAGFDQYAADYDTALAQGISVSGEDKIYFARRRVEWLAHCLRLMSKQPARLMDFGCGTGAATPFLLDLLGGESLIGVDTAEMLLKVARREFGSDRVRFANFAEHQPAGDRDLVFCNGVFHHIPVAERNAVVDYIYRSLRPGGLFAPWENNPWNPGTRYVMSRIPFDRDAITLTPREMDRLLRANGFEVLSQDFLFIFPRALRWFRPIESHVSKLPFGAQYQIICRKPASAKPGGTR